MKTIKLDYITKIYGHANLNIKIRNRKVKKAELNVFESSRFFESLVKGNKYDEIDSITSRICGICSASHNITSIMAMEDAFRIKPSEETERLRELLICGEYIQSHALHSFFLALPSYMGYPGILDMAKDHKPIVEMALQLKRLGNLVSTVVGGRSIHPVITKVGGFYELPEKNELKEILKNLKKSKNLAIKSARLFSKLETEKFQRERSFLALKHPKKYSLLHGKLSLNDKSMPQKLYKKHVKLHKKPYSTSKFVTWNREEYTVGPLARLNLNHKKLGGTAKKCLKISKLKLPSLCPFDANIARIIELGFCIDRSMELIKKMKYKTKAKDVKLKNKKYAGSAITEAPRGILYHSYVLNRKGVVLSSSIITPTAQNLNSIENDVKAFLPLVLKRDNKKIVSFLEDLIRTYDPCISCATHFLNVKFL